MTLSFPLPDFSYDEVTALKIERLAEEQAVLPHRVIVDAIAAYAEPPKQDSDEELRQVIEEMRRIHQQEIQAVINEVRDRQIEMQKQIIERDCKIAELEAQIASRVAPLESHSDRTSGDATPRLKVGARVLLKISPIKFSSLGDEWEIVGIRGTKISVSLRGQGKPVITDSSNVAKVLLAEKNQ